MSNKAIVYLGAAIGGLLGGFLPAMFGIGTFSAWSIVGSFIGGIAGIWIVWRWLNG